MSMQYIRDAYGVPAKRGMKVEYCGRDNIRRRGRITSASHYVHVRFEGKRTSVRIHPTDDYLIYLSNA